MSGTNTTASRGTSCSIMTVEPVNSCDATVALCNVTTMQLTNILSR